ncbi:hypothetical protein OH77DRAFT_731599 [Trametes cingulata]|nr:hypothetical protein OH77DRAFT_731599 [Trametes cingulata]
MTALASLHSKLQDSRYRLHRTCLMRDLCVVYALTWTYQLLSAGFSRWKTVRVHLRMSRTPSRHAFFRLDLRTFPNRRSAGAPSSRPSRVYLSSCVTCENIFRASSPSRRALAGTDLPRHVPASPRVWSCCLYRFVNTLFDLRSLPLPTAHVQHVALRGCSRATAG